MARKDKDELAREVWQVALRLRREENWPEEKINEFISGSPLGVRNMEDLSRVVMELETEQIDPGLAVAISQGAGQGLSLGFLDELAGVVGALRARVPGSKVTAKEAYLQARDEYRELYRVSKEAHPVATGAAELAGAVTSGFASAPLFTAGAGLTGLPALARAAGASAALGGAESLGRAEEITPETLREAGRAAAGSGAAGAALAGAARFAQNRISPGAYQIEQGLKELGPNPAAVLQERAGPILAQGRRPVLAELARPMTELGTIQRTGPRVREAARRYAQAGAGEALEEAEVIRKTVGAKFNQIERVIIRDKRIDEVLEQPYIKKLIKSGIETKDLEGPKSHRSVNVLRWVSGKLRDDARQEITMRRRIGKGNTRAAAGWNKTADQIERVLEEKIPGYQTLLSEYAAAAKPAERLRKMTETLERVRGLSKPGPGEQFSYAIKEPFGVSTTAQRQRAAQTISETLYTPGGSVEELLDLVYGLRRGWTTAVAGAQAVSGPRRRLRRERP